MQIALYRLGRFAARRPWTVLGVWFVLSVVLVGASLVGGKAFEDEFSVPGLDSDEPCRHSGSVDCGCRFDVGHTG